MPIYVYKATDASGKVVDGRLDSESEAGVVRKLRELSFYPIKIAQVGSKSAPKIQTSEPPKKGKIRRKDVMWFTVQISALLDAGITLDYALGVLTEITENPALKDLTITLRRTIREGGSFSDSLARYPKHFNALYVNMVRAGEAGGALESVLSNLAKFLEKEQEVRAYVKSLMVYPAILVSFGTGAILVLLTVVLPKFSRIFEEVGIPLPLPTQILLTGSELLLHYWWAGALSVALLITALKGMGRSPAGRERLDRWKLGFPLLGPLNHKRMVGRFCRTLASLLKGGVPMLTAFSIIREVMQNKIMADAVAKVQDRVKEGDSVAQPLRETGAFPALAVHMITVGQETGRLEEMLNKVADTLEVETGNAIQAITAVIGPALIVVMAVLVGFIVLSVILPILTMNQMAG